MSEHTAKKGPSGWPQLWESARPSTKGPTGLRQHLYSFTRRLSLLVVLIGLCCATGCMEFTTAVALEEDGSGKVTVQVIYKPETSPPPGASAPFLRDLYLSTQSKIADKLGLRVIPNVTEKDARRLAQHLGPGVRFFTFQPFRSGEGRQGFIATYEFDDIRTLRVGPRNVLHLTGTHGDDGLMDWTYGFRYTNLKSPHRLTILPPEGRKEAGALMTQLEGLSREPAFDLVLARKLAEARYKLEIRTPGTVKKSDADFQEGNTTVLIDICSSNLVSHIGLASFLNTSEPRHLVPWSKLSERDPKVRLDHPLCTRRLDLLPAVREEDALPE